MENATGFVAATVASRHDDIRDAASRALCLSVLAAPVSWTHYFVLLIAPFGVAFGRIVVTAGVITSSDPVDSVDDLRIKMCIDVNAEDFTTIHHELGHNFYQRAYNQQPFLYRDGAHDGFHEAIGDFIALNITPQYLVDIGLLRENQIPPASADTTRIHDGPWGSLKASTTSPVLLCVSAATRAFGSCSRIASRMESEIWSATLSG